MRDTQPQALDAQRAHFEEHGWVVLRGVVPQADLVELNRVFDDVMAPFAAPPDGTRRGVIQRPNACRDQSALLRHLRDGVAAIACDLLGAPSVQLLQDTLLLKHPSAAGSVPLHQDYAYTGYLDPPSSLSVGLALTDATRESGCLYVIDASHTWGLIGGFRVFATEMQKDFGSQLSPAQRERMERAKVPLEVRAGDVTIHHCLTLHGSDDNMSDRPRKTVVTHVFSSSCTLIRERLPAGAQDQFTTNDEGRLTPPLFPTLHSSPSAIGASRR